jgi:alkylated DNA repair dioxygenase AlkB
MTTKTATPECILHRYREKDLVVDYYSNFIDEETSYQIFETILETVDEKGLWAHEHATKKGELSKRRNKCVFGDSDLERYRFVYQGKEVRTVIHPWSEMPILKELRDMITKISGQEYHVCFVQLYNDGRTGIEKHVDKEMMPGTIISSLSVGATRTMRFEHPSTEQIVDLPLETGSLCLMRPPTNDKWLHSILKDETETARMSLIFRNVANMKG